MEVTHKFSINKKYYTGIVYEWNLPTGHTCPYAKECLVKVDRETGKFVNSSNAYRCYAAAAERFPSARKSRWRNFDYVRNGGIPEIPKKCKSVRIHASGDFYSQEYFDMWLDVAKNNPDVEFWAFTKSIPYWARRLKEIPENLTLTASRGGRFDDLIKSHNLRWCKVVKKSDVEFTESDDGYQWCVLDGVSYPIDTNDDWARVKGQNFILLDNNEK